MKIKIQIFTAESGRRDPSTVRRIFTWFGRVKNQLSDGNEGAERTVDQLMNRSPHPHLKLKLIFRWVENRLFDGNDGCAERTFDESKDCSP